MKNAKKIAIIATASVSALMLGACGHRGGNANNPKKDKLSVALITGGFGVDDNSFGQMAWSGIKKYGKYVYRDWETKQRTAYPYLDCK